MSTTTPVSDAESDPAVKKIFDDIRQTRQSDFINNFWLYLANYPLLLESTWRDVKDVMASPSSLDQKTKEMIYVAVSVANACSYCVHSHTASAKANGMTDEEYTELLQIVSLAARTNHLVTALQVPVDKVFDLSAP